MHKQKLFKCVNKELPIYLISGDDDPCTGKEKGVKSTYNALKKIGFNVQEPKIYKHARHEILNESIKDEVIKDVISYLR
jgi:alpha-beta hydrolase superfamily lysophospholipase